MLIVLLLFCFSFTFESILILNKHSTMLFKKINIKNELTEHKENTSKAILQQVAEILSFSVKQDEDIIFRLQQNPSKVLFDWSMIEPNDQKNVFTLEQIKSVCIKYNLRFLDTAYFKADFPYEAILKTKMFEDKYQTKIEHFKLVAPSQVFNLGDCNQDPLLFACLADNKYYLIHQWGSDLSWYRGLISFPIKSVYSFFAFMWLPAALIAFGIPFSWLHTTPEGQLSLRLWLMVYCFITLFFFVIFLGSTTQKNFSDNCWDSKYFNQ